MKFKKILSLLTAAAMTLSLGITSVSADTTDAEIGGGAETTTYVAQIGDTKYETLAAAFANANDRDTVTVIADTSIAGKPVEYHAKSVTLDLNDHTVTAENKDSGNIAIFDGATLTLKDSGTEGKGAILSNSTKYVKGTADKTVISVDRGSHFVMESGTIESVYPDDTANSGHFAVGVWKNSSATINGGTIKAGWYCVSGNGSITNGEALGENAEITVNGGNLISTADYAIYAPAVGGKVTVNGGTIYGATGAVAMKVGTLSVTGGTLTTDKTSTTGNWGDGTGNLGNSVIILDSTLGKVNATISGGKIIMPEGTVDPILSIDAKTDVTYKGSSLTIDGGVFSEDIRTDYADHIKEGADIKANKDGTYVVNPAARIGAGSNAVYYATLQDAVDAVPNNSTSWETIYLTRDINTDGTAAYIKDKTRKIKISLYGFNLTASGYDGAFYVENSYVVLHNSERSTGGVVTAKEDNKYAMGVWASKGATVILRELTFKQEITSNPADDQYDMIYANKDAKITVESGTFESATPKWTLNKYDTDSATISVTGGTFYQYNPAESDTEPNGPVCFVADGYYVSKSGDNYVVFKTPVAEVNDGSTVSQYGTLDDAVKAVKDNGKATIKLLENVSSRTIISGKKDITLDLNGHKVSGYSSSSYGVLNAAEGTLTITDSVGGGSVVAKKYNAIAIAVSAYNDAVLNIEGGTFTQEGVTDSDLESSSQYDMIYAYDNAVVNIKGGTFKSVTPEWTLNILDSSNAKFNVTGGKFYNYNPAAAKTEPTKPTSFVADGYVATADASGNYTVEKRTEDFGNVAIMTHGNGKLTLFAGINFLDYRNAGFIVNINGKETEVKTNKVYEQVTAGDAKFDTTTAGTNYIYGAELTLDPGLNGSLKSFTVTPFADVLNKTAERIASSKVTTVKITGATAETTVEE